MYWAIRASPVSITYRIPGMVIEVSATFVATTIFLSASGRKTRCCSAVVRREKRGRIAALSRKPAGEEIAGLADVLLRGHEDQHVPGLAPFDNLVDGADGRLDVGDLPLLLESRVEGMIADLDGVEPSRHLDDGGIAEGLARISPCR